MGRAAKMMKFRKYMLAIVALAFFAGAVVPANAAGHHHHRKHHKR
jgi:hypothetical protein